jgi:transposase
MVPKVETSIAPDNHARLFVALELSKKWWKVGFALASSANLSHRQVAGGDTAALGELVGRKRAEAEKALGMPVEVICCYEAGYDGFWLHRWLEAQGVVNHVLDPSSIEVDRRKRRAKTDRIDVVKLMRALMSYYRGDLQACRIVHVPSVEEEAAKELHRERERLVCERGGHVNRIKALLFKNGVRDAHPLSKRFDEFLLAARTGDGRPLPTELADEVRRELVRLRVVVEHVTGLEAKIAAGLRKPAPASSAFKAAQLMTLRSIGQASAQTLAHEVYYRSFANQRQVGSYLGLTGTPYDSGETRRDQGISKAGNRRARTMMIELAWLWVRHQRNSALTLWFKQRVGTAKGPVRKNAIVALARKLAIALWRFVETGLVPTGAQLRAGRAG